MSRMIWSHAICDSIQVVGFGDQSCGGWESSWGGAADGLEWQSATDIYRGTSFPAWPRARTIIDGQYWMSMDRIQFDSWFSVQNEVQNPPQTDDVLVQHDWFVDPLWPVCSLLQTQKGNVLQHCSFYLHDCLKRWRHTCWFYGCLCHKSVYFGSFWRLLDALHWFYGWFHGSCHHLAASCVSSRLECFLPGLRPRLNSLESTWWSELIPPVLMLMAINY